MKVILDLDSSAFSKRAQWSKKKRSLQYESHAITDESNEFIR